jgi:hypothetical protein
VAEDDVAGQVDVRLEAGFWRMPLPWTFLPVASQLSFLSFAGYNAGHGRVKDWIAKYGCATLFCDH